MPAWRFARTQDSGGTYVNINQAPCTVASRRPYPNFTNFYINSDWHGYAKYNAMNVKFEHRSGDLAVTGVFTWAKSMDDKSAAAGVGGTGKVSRAPRITITPSWTTALRTSTLTTGLWPATCTSCLSGGERNCSEDQAGRSTCSSEAGR